MAILAVLLAGCGSPASGPVVPDDRAPAGAAVPTPPAVPVPSPPPAPDPTPPPAPGRDADAPDAWRVVDVIDGDTVDVRGPDGRVERVRVIGIDTPERGRCGYGEASLALAEVVVGVDVVLVGGARDDRDRYGRLLRYLDVPSRDGTVDAGLVLLELGLAVARYDSRDGYGRHPREAVYVAADLAAPDIACGGIAPDATVVPGAGPGTGPGGSWRNCTEARAAGAAPVRVGDPGFGPHLDGDGDGVGCE